MTRVVKFFAVSAICALSMSACSNDSDSPGTDPGADADVAGDAGDTETGGDSTESDLGEPDVAFCEADSCSDNGDCVESSDGLVCLCDPGYDGETCDECTANFRDDEGECVPSERCTSTSCASNGDCDDSTGLVVCTCAEGYAAPGCASCDAGYHRNADDECVRNVSCDDGDPCLAGVCDDTTGVVECYCYDGYTGDNCDECYPGYARNRVSGECQLPCIEGEDWIRCEDGCVDPTDVNSCGGCGIDCGDGICQSFTCQCPQSSSFATCDGSCTDLDINGEHCGGCGESCEEGESCVLGRCVVEDGACAPMSGDTVCPDPDVCCAPDFCYYQSDVSADLLNCGGCGVECEEGDLCVRGACQTGTSDACTDCKTGEICCDYGDGGGLCLTNDRLLEDRDNCSGCGIACDPGEVCSAGLCFCPDETCDVDGVDTCVDTSSSSEHCGACGDPCDMGEVCVLGECVEDDGDGCDESCEVCCELGETDACLSAFELTWSEDHCGACGNACADGESCVEGVCVCDSTQPAGSAALCDGECTPLNTETDCASCGDDCDSGERCVDGFCGCPDDPSWDTCDDVCTFVAGDLAHCGACDEACDAGDVCDQGSCCTPAGTAPTGDDATLCCSEAVDVDGLCTSSACLAPRSTCSDSGDAECCEGFCGGDGTCCIIDGARRGDGVPPSACCSGDPDENGTCGAQPVTCRGLGGACLDDSQCCTQTCSVDGACCRPDGSSYANPASCCNLDDDLDGLCGGTCVETGEPVPAHGGLGCCVGYAGGDGSLCGGEVTCSPGLEPCTSNDQCCNNNCAAIATPVGILSACCLADGFDLVGATGSTDAAALLLGLCCNGDPDGDYFCGTATCLPGGEVALDESWCCEPPEDTTGENIICGGSSRIINPQVTPCIKTGQPYSTSTAECCDNNDPDFDGRCGLGLGICSLPGEYCLSSCCGGDCVDGACCLSDGEVISTSAACCNGNPDNDIYCGTSSCVRSGDAVRSGGEGRCCSGTATFSICD